MSVSITEVLESAGYDITSNAEDVVWLISKIDEIYDLADYAESMEDLHNEYLDFCDSQDIDVPTFQQWIEKYGEEYGRRNI